MVGRVRSKLFYILLNISKDGNFVGHIYSQTFKLFEMVQLKHHLMSLKVLLGVEGHSGLEPC